jgi:uncharacterized protein YndB with AHSA1/START domain
MKSEPFVIERTYPVSPARVWKALTDRDQMKQWFFDIAQFKPEVGFEFTFEGHNEGMTYIHLCKVTEVIAGRRLSYSWRYKGHEGNSLVTIELFDEGDKTRVKLTHSGIETFPASPAFAKKNFESGWTHLIGISLQEFLEKRAVKG